MQCSPLCPLPPDRLCGTTTQGLPSFPSQKVGLCHSSLPHPESLSSQGRFAKSGRRDHLVRATSRQLGMGKEIKSHVSLGNVSSDRKSSLGEKTRLGRVGHFNTVDLNADVARRLVDVDSLGYSATSAWKLHELMVLVPCKGPSGGHGFRHPPLAKRLPCQRLF